MKRCPECRRDYYDDSLLFCLDDGTALLEGPASVDEPATAILPETAPPNEAATRPQIHTTEQAGVLPSGSGDAPRARKFDKRLLLAPALAILALAASFGYRYFNSSNSQQINSIAVLPFVNDGQNPDLEYLSEGMTETLVNSLSRLPGLSVKARSSAVRYKGRESDVQTIGKELGVQAILNGRVVKRDDILTLFLELVDTSNGNRMWGQQYTEPLANIVILQNRIARDVSQKLSIRLSGDDQKKLARNYTENAEAYQLYLQGRFYLNKRTPDAFRSATPLFERAIGTDPNYALAYTGLSDSYGLLGVYAGGLPAKEAFPKAKDAALKALSIDHELAEAHESPAHVLGDYEFDWTGSEKEYKRAIELNPNLASAHQWYSELLTSLGRFDEAQASIQRALDLDPMSLIFNRVKGMNLIYAKRVDDSIEQLKRTVALDPAFPSVHEDLADAYQIKGLYAESVEARAKRMELAGDKTTAERARESFSKSGWAGFLRAMTDRSHHSPFLDRTTRTIFYVALGDHDNAMIELERAIVERPSDMRWLAVEVRFDPLRSDPRFQELYKKVGLP